jgi:hypothetical protein
MKYLGSPYTSLSKAVMQMRYEMARKVCAEMLNNGEITYSPIVHCHELARHHDLTRDFAFWQHYNFAMLDLASELVVLRLEGWEDSTGLRGEIEHAKSLSLPISFRDL